MVDGLKRCETCKLQLPATSEYFNRNRSKRDGLNTQCKICRRMWYANHAPRLKEIRRQKLADYILELQPGALRCCTKCKREFPATLDYFDKSPFSKGGLSSYCKTCRREDRRNYAMTHPDVERARLQRYYEKNPDKVRAQNRVKQRRRSARLRSLSDTLSNEQWEACLSHWGHSCAVCGRVAGFWHVLAMDHWIPITSLNCPGTVVYNIVPLCHGEGGCNNSKRNSDPERWLVRRYGTRKAKQISKKIEAYFDLVRPV